MNGIALAKVLREKWPEIYVIFVTDGTQIPVSRGHLTKVKREINLRWSRE